MLFGCGTDAVQEMPLPEGLVYRRINNTEYEIYTDDEDVFRALEVEKIVFPSYHNGLPVTHIEAYLGPRVNEVVLSSQLTDLEGCKLYHTAIDYLEIPAGCTVIPEYLCNGCRYLTEVKLPDRPVTIDSEAFRDCNSLKKINLGKVTQIGSSAFSKTALRQVVIPTSMESIGQYAFQDSVLTAIMPKTVRSIDGIAFSCADIYTDTAGSHLGWQDDVSNGNIKSFLSAYPSPGSCFWFGDGSHVFRECTFRYDGDTPYVYSMPNQLLSHVDGEFTNEEGKAEDEFVPVRAFSVPFREGYTFKGWSLEEGSSEVEFGVTMFDPTLVPELQSYRCMWEPYLCSLSTVGDWLRFTPNQTLYAVWEKE